MPLYVHILADTSKKYNFYAHATIWIHINKFASYFCVCVSHFFLFSFWLNKRINKQTNDYTGKSAKQYHKMSNECNVHNLLVAFNNY